MVRVSSLRGALLQAGLTLVALLCGVWAPAEALFGQSVASDASDADVPDPLTVYLVTAAPGDAIWERFGHNGIWIHDEVTGQDIFWEWGLFSFQQEGFMARLARGTMLYSMGGRYLEDMLEVYRRQGRAVWAQELNLTPAQEAALDQAIRLNALPENRDYVYDYYTDNCSTRTRDALDTVLGGDLEEHFGSQSAGVSWRWHTRRLLRPVPWAEAGVQIVLGRPGDEAISRWEEMFLPMRLRASLEEVRVTRDGRSEPLVRQEIQLLDSPRSAPPSAPANRLGLAALAGVILAGLVLLLGRGASRATLPRRALGGILTVWAALAGALGAVLLVAWVATDHDHWRWNENLLLLNPALLAAPFLALPMMLGRLPGPGLRRLLAGVAVLSASTLALKILPGAQGNGDVLLLALAMNGSLAWAVRALPEGGPEQESETRA